MILVVGASGTLGGAVARGLLERGEHVCVLVRPQSNYQPLVDAGAVEVFGDLKDPPSLVAACEGVDVVITTANSALRGAPDTVESVDRAGNRNLIDAARTAGTVKQFVFVSAYGVTPDSPVPFVAAKAETEAYLKASRLMYTILAPNIFMDVWLPVVVGMPAAQGQPVTVVGEGTRRHSFVALRDVRDYALAVVGQPVAFNQTIAIGGSQPISWRDVVSAYSRALGREILLRSVAPGEPVPGLPPQMVELLTAMAFYDSPIDMAETSRMFGVPPTSVEDFVRAAAVPA